MKKISRNIIFASLHLCIFAFLITSCSDYLDLKPKGQTLLDNIDDLELLATGSYSQSCWEYSDMEVLVNDAYGKSTSFMTNVVTPNTVAHAVLTYDETVNRAGVTESDQQYSRNYSSISPLNQVINTIDDVDGTATRKAAIKAVAKVKRAYFHYLIMLKYCKQYTTAEEAATMGGIPYVTEINVSEENPKLTLKEVYDKLLDDCSDETLAALYDEPTNIELPGKAFGYAVRAKILLQMKDYTNALKYAEMSLKYNSKIDDHTGVVASPTSYSRTQLSEDNLFYAEAVSSGAGTYYLSHDIEPFFEDGDCFKDYAIASQTTKKTTYYWNPTTITGLTDKVFCWSAGSKYRCNSGGITSEQMYYTAAECAIRTGKISDGMKYINYVRKYRIDPAKYADLTASTEAEAMAILQKCKRIECLFTYNNYADIKRWNTESNYKQTIIRHLNGMTYTLSPDSPLWVFPFPKDATEYNSTLTQNY